MRLRPTRRSLYMQIAVLWSSRGTCPRKQVGCVIVRDKRIISHGYNGAPSGLQHCEDVGCDLGFDGGCLRAVHAEANAICFAAKEGIATYGTEMYCEIGPCTKCAHLMINAGIYACYYMQPYRDGAGESLMKAAGRVCEPLINLKPVV